MLSQPGNPETCLLHQSPMPADGDPGLREAGRTRISVAVALRRPVRGPSPLPPETPNGGPEGPP